MITLEGISVTFGKGTPLERRVLRDVSLKVADKEFCTLIGSNGSGKTTLMRTIAGEIAPESGRIYVSGADVTGFSGERRAALVARVLRDPTAGTCGTLTVAENLAIAARRGAWRGLGNAVSRHRMRYIFERVAELAIGLEKRLDEPMDALSASHRQALALVMATLSRSSVVLLHEHTAMLTPPDAAYVLELTGTLAARFGLTVLMATNSFREALEIGGRTIMLHEGEIVLDLGGPERSAVTVDDLRARFRRARGEELDEARPLAG